MWWIQTAGYHLAGLVWLIAIGVVGVIALVALITAGAAATTAKRTRRILLDREAYLGASAPGANAGVRPVESQVMASRPFPVTRDDLRNEPGPAEGPADPSLGDSPRILHERYARGEITREEYLRAREDMMATKT
jgi:hypothetical protein